MKHITALLLLAMNAQAAPVTISWSLATEREDGTPLYEHEIAGSNFWFNFSGSSWGPFIVNPDFTSININTSPNGLCLKLSTVLNDGTESAPTDWLCLSDTPEAPQ